MGIYISDGRCRFYGLFYLIIFGCSLTILVFNGQKHLAGLGNKTVIGNALYTTSTIFNIFIIIFLGLEIILRAIMSALSVYPCDFQRRRFCCFDYGMHQFWLIVSIMSGVTTVVEVALTVLLFFIDVGYGKLDIIRLAVLCGCSILQFILCLILRSMAKNDFYTEVTEEDGGGEMA
eukprot:TRINITY_DN290_c0_g1_i1.p1 TRINITY_DN290_c0_g1~~TRINITY_DN290_c0_g1_i1.p1  ORF type:complete len:176 (+),score=14.00 TRINITY_DN290_c0_g1_i1:252-779(+)